MSLRYARPFLMQLCSALVLVGTVHAQEASVDLDQRVTKLDAAVFSAFNDRDSRRFLSYFSEELEFYHDVDGRSGYAEMVASADRLFAQASPLRREIVAGSIEVHAVPGYGAIQIGRHQFCHRENGADDCGVFGFTHLWQQAGDEWLITRVLSYGH